MVAEFNSFILSDQIIEKMRNKMKETREKRKELGFGLCKSYNKSDNILTDGKECEGGVCSLGLTKGCKNINQILIGHFHTHPTATSSLSIIDMVTGCQENIECVGSVRFNDIKCFVRKTDKNSCFNETRPEEIKLDKILKEKKEIDNLLRTPKTFIRPGIHSLLIRLIRNDIAIESFNKKKRELLAKHFSEHIVSRR